MYREKLKIHYLVGVEVMKDYNAIKYTTTFLNQVIIRVDFLQFLETDSLFHDSIEKCILKSFPRRGMDQKVHFNTINVVIDSNIPNMPDAQKETLEGIQREYCSGKNKIILSNKFIVYEINDYSSFENHYQVLLSILPSLYFKQRITSARIGIRYINIFGPDRIKLRKNMFTPGISATFYAKENMSDTGVKLLRAMNMNEYQVDNMLLNFRFGMFNPDYPNPLDKESFALDYDCFITEPIDSTDEVLRTIRTGHDAIQELFEQSITDSLRKVLTND